MKGTRPQAGPKGPGDQIGAKPQGLVPEVFRDQPLQFSSIIPLRVS